MTKRFQIAEFRLQIQESNPQFNLKSNLKSEL
jgi:hypothetical protein